MSSSPAAPRRRRLELTPNTGVATARPSTCWPVRPSMPAYCRAPLPGRCVEPLGVDADGAVDVSRLETSWPARTCAGVMVACRPPTTRPACCSRPDASPSWRTRRRGARPTPYSSPAARPCELDAIGADVLILSSHKLGGPKGVGAVVLVASACSPAADPRRRAGAPAARRYRERRGHRRIRRGFERRRRDRPRWPRRGAAAASGGRLRAIRHRHRGVRRDARAPAQHDLLCRSRHAGRDGVIALDLDGVAVSAGSACSSGKVARATCSRRWAWRRARPRRVRVSPGRGPTEADIDAFLSAWAKINGRRASRGRLEALESERGRRGMPAVQETIDQVKRIDVDQYKYGFETDIESVKAPKGLDENTVAFISKKKGEPAWMLEWRLEAFRRWKTMTEPTWAKRALPQDRLPGPLLLLGAEIDRRPQEPRRRRSRAAAHLREARHPAEGAGDLWPACKGANVASPSTPCSTPCPSSPPSRTS